jgi:hypothetical protein
MISYFSNPLPDTVPCVTPKSVTPSTHMYPQIALRGSLSSETVSRGQGDGQSSHRDIGQDKYWFSKQILNMHLMQVHVLPK